MKIRKESHILYDLLFMPKVYFHHMNQSVKQRNVGDRLMLTVYFLMLTVYFLSEVYILHLSIPQINKLGQYILMPHAIIM